MSCGVGRKHGSDLALLWLWRRPTDTALIQPLAWECPCAAGGALKSSPPFPAKKKNNPKNKTKKPYFKKVTGSSLVAQ